MAVSLRHASVLKHRRWEAAFGHQATLTEVIAFMGNHWTKLQAHPPPDMRFSSKEPRITRYFCQSLFKFAPAAGILGFFVPENPVADIDEVKQELEYRGRTDITYLDNATQEPINAVFEFKKMKMGRGANGSRKDYCRDGLRRYVDATYARYNDFGFMVGLVEHGTDLAETIAGVKRVIQAPDMRDNELKIIQSPNGDYVTMTGLTFSACSFETRHARDHCNKCDVAIGHLFLTHSP
jgi:hypothetical protein